MPLSGETLANLRADLDILDGLTKAFKNLDELFDDLTAEAGQNGVSTKDSDRYATHCQLLSDLHTLVVDDLTNIRDNLVCVCGQADCTE